MTIARERLDPAPSPVRRGVNRVAHSWDKTPGKLRVTRLVVVLVCLTAGVVGMYSAHARVDVAREIAHHTEPLSADAVDVYRSLADADAAVAREFLRSSDGDVADAQTKYEAAIKRAATSLAHAGTQASEEGLSTDRIARIAAALPVYTGLVERARARGNNVEELRDASARMQSTILRQTEALQRDEAGRLDGQYRQAGSLPYWALALGGLCLGVLVGAQVLLFRRTKRVVNVGLLAATVAILGAVAWWAIARSESHPQLRSSQRHSQSVTAALGQAQIAARQARTIELLSLQAPDPSADRNFNTKIQLLARHDGDILGGALGAAAAFASDDAGRARVAAAVAETAAWLKAHGQLTSNPDAARRAFETLDGTLSGAVKEEDKAFTNEINRAQAALARPVAVTGLAALLAAGAAAWGIGRRLEEYR